MFFEIDECGLKGLSTDNRRTSAKRPNFQKRRHPPMGRCYPLYNGSGDRMHIDENKICVLRHFEELWNNGQVDGSKISSLRAS